MKEQESNSKWEIRGKRLLYTGIIAGVLGLIAAIPLIVEGGVVLAAGGGGIIFESKVLKNKQKAPKPA